jgi:hypothetical protein
MSVYGQFRTFNTKQKTATKAAVIETSVQG